MSRRGYTVFLICLAIIYLGCLITGEGEIPGGTFVQNKVISMAGVNPRQ